MAAKNTSPKLMDEYPLMVYPSLAVTLGLDEAILLQQLHYWADRSGHVRDGHKWVYNTYAQWHEQFPFWSERTIRRVIGNLEELGIIISTDQYNAHPVDRTKWYRIDYRKLDATKPTNDDNARPCGQTGHATRTDWPAQEVAKMATSIPETTETTQTETNSIGRKPKRAVQLPDDFKPTADMFTWGQRELSMTLHGLATETDQFRDYHMAKGSTFKDWDAAWRTWMRNSVKFASKSNGTYKPREVRDDVVTRNLRNLGVLDEPEPNDYFETTGFVQQ